MDHLTIKTYYHYILFITKLYGTETHKPKYECKSNPKIMAPIVDIRAFFSFSDVLQFYV